MSAERLFLIGGVPGSGKSTVAEALARADGLEHLSMGNHLRKLGQQAVRSRHYVELQHERQALANSGQLPTRLVVGIAEEYLSDGIRRPEVLIDGYPRYREQVTPFFEMVHRNGIQPIALVHLHASEDVAMQRIFERGSRVGECGVDEEFALRRIREHERSYPDALRALEQHIRVYPIEASGALEEVLDAARSCFVVARAARG